MSDSLTPTDELISECFGLFGKTYDPTEYQNGHAPVVPKQKRSTAPTTDYGRWYLDQQRTCNDSLHRALLDKEIDVYTHSNKRYVDRVREATIQACCVKGFHLKPLDEQNRIRLDAMNSIPVPGDAQH